ncbi:hypothetical protein EJ02DRAFT_456296 [Clathrospora elynae]|uniref:Uncharacterized protein n=1 Tax=Clathrospora elynae TaxID=706981 RepID=A0A6A5SHK3_9PLEO|nr:hypothetical protein EJ02DRAFT_456296 [Clathrospora elynae]
MTTLVTFTAPLTLPRGQLLSRQTYLLYSFRPTTAVQPGNPKLANISSLASHTTHLMMMGAGRNKPCAVADRFSSLYSVTSKEFGVN